jgi:hypothetical protein
VFGNINSQFFSMKADIYFAKTSQSAYGEVVQSWYLDHTIDCDFTYAGVKSKEEIIPNAVISVDSLLLGRSTTDFRVNNRGERFGLQNIIVTNIRDKFGEELYMESGGGRNGKSTVYEIATFKPFIGPFGKTEHYSVILRRSEHQRFAI